MEGLCPDSYYCDHEDERCGYAASNSKLLPIQGIIGTVSSVLSIVGATIILIAYCAFKDLRKGTAQTIITLLSLADMGTAFGCLLGIVNYYNYIFQRLMNSDNSGACRIFDNICQIQASLTFWCLMSSSIWSTVLAVHFLLSLLLSDSRWTERLLPLYNIVAWTLPIIIILPLLITGQLGYSPDYPSFCLLNASTSANETKGLEKYVIWMELLLNSLITIVCYAATFVLIYLKVCIENSFFLAVSDSRRPCLIMVYSTEAAFSPWAEDWKKATCNSCRISVAKTA